MEGNIAFTLCYMYRNVARSRLSVIRAVYCSVEHAIPMYQKYICRGPRLPETSFSYLVVKHRDRGSEYRAPGYAGQTHLTWENRGMHTIYIKRHCQSHRQPTSARGRGLAMPCLPMLLEVRCD